MAEAEPALSNNQAGKSDTPPHKPPSKRPERLHQIIPRQLDLLRAYHCNVLDTLGVEAVHKMRVTTRRLQASLDLLEREMKVRRLKRSLRNWRRALSLVRNYDVFLEMLEQETTARGRARRKQFQLVKSKLHEHRSETAAAVRGVLEKIDIDKIGLRLGIEQPVSETSGAIESKAKPGPREATKLASIDDRSVAAYAADRLDQRLGEFLALAAQAMPTGDPADLHQLRIAAKRVRYLLEIVSQMGYGDASTALAWLRILQDRIGDWHDLEALEEEIISIVSDYQFLKEHLEECSDMLQAAARLQKKKERLVSHLFPVRVPKHLVMTSQRIARALRRHATRNQETAIIDA